MDFTTVTENLMRRGFAVSSFTSKEDAAAYLNTVIDETTVGFGGSVTLDEMGVYESLSAHNSCYWHWRQSEGMTEREMRNLANGARVYLSSVNGLAETGEVINIDATANRVAAILYGHEKVYLVAGKNKIAPDYDTALWRARNVASPKNAQRLGVNTPCAVKGDRCYDCQSAGRICRTLSVLWEKPFGTDIEVILIDEELGY